jgi:hypothetical protein
MDATFSRRISQFLTVLQTDVFPLLRDEMELELSPALEKVIRVLELVQVERLVPSSRGWVGAPRKDRLALARSLVAKAVLNLPTTEALIDRLKVDVALRRLCGFDHRHRVPGAWRFSRAFAECAAGQLPARVHEVLIGAHLSDQLIGHMARDSTEIEAREKPAKRVKSAGAEADETPKRRGRPKKGEERVKVPTRLERQTQRTLEENLAELPTACDVGSKKNSKGFKETWVGYKLHIDTADGDIPVTALLTSASLHDSQVALPLMQMSSKRVTYLYDLADAAYCSPIVRDEARRLNHVPLIDHNPRRGEKIEFAPHEAQRYKVRSQAERVNSQLKDHYGGRQVRVRGHAKVYAHLMFGVLAIAAEQILRLLN